jgi:hypothetical protein
LRKGWLSHFACSGTLMPMGGLAPMNCVDARPVTFLPDFLLL